jgi:hypothetical protein
LLVRFSLALPLYEIEAAESLPAVAVPIPHSAFRNPQSPYFPAPAMSWMEQTGAFPVGLPLTSHVQTSVRTGSLISASRSFSTITTAFSGHTLMHSPQWVQRCCLTR